MTALYELYLGVFACAYVSVARQTERKMDNCNHLLEISIPPAQYRLHTLRGCCCSSNPNMASYLYERLCSSIANRGIAEICKHPYPEGEP